MHRTLTEHIAYLEQRIESLKREMDGPGKSPVEIKQVGIDLGIAERSLTHFRKAYELEMKLSRAVARGKQNSN